MARVSITTRPKKKNGTLPLYVRVEASGKTLYVSLGYRIAERHWNPSGSVRKSHPQYHKLNKWLTGVQAQAQEELTAIVTSGQAVTAARIKAAIRTRLSDEEEAPQQDFIKYAEELIDAYERRGQVATAKSYRSQVNKLKEFAVKTTGRGEVPFDALTVGFLRDFETFLRETRENSTNTVSKSMGRIRAVLYQAIKEGRFPQEKNPFFQISLKTEKVEKGSLTPEEIDKIAALDLEPGSLIWHVQGWFLFAFYAGGMRFSDVALLERRHLEGGRVRYKMKKTAEGAGVALVHGSVAILERYADRDPSPHARVFPILDGYDLTTAENVHAAISRANALTNKYLKKIASKAGIKRPISFHLSRHSLAHYLQRKGWDVYRISKVLAHANVKVTERYLSGFDSQSMDEDYRGAFG